MTTLIKARWLIGWDGRGHRIIEDGELVLEGATVRFAGRGWAGTADRTVDYGNAVVGPGFVDLDALADIDSTILGFDNQPGWRKGRVWPRAYHDAGPREALGPAELDLAKRWAYVSLLRNGITTMVPITSIIYRAWSETAEEFERAVDIAAEVGIRAYLGPAYCSGRPVVDDRGQHVMHFDEARGLAGLDDALAFIDRFDGRHDGLIRGFLAPDRIEGCTERLIERTRDAAVERAVPVRLHCCQSGFEVDTIEARFGTSSLAVLEGLGVLALAPLLPHGVCLGGARPDAAAVEADVLRLERSGAVLVHCPLVMARHGHALTDLGTLRSRGVKIGMGTDTFPADMLLNLQVGVAMARVSSGDPGSASAADLYDAATVGGADALRRPDLGRLCAGSAADLTVFDLDQPGAGPFVDPVQTLVLAGAGLGFRDVYVAGRQVIRDGEPIGIDRRALHGEINRVYREFRDTYPARTPGRPPVSEIFEPAYPLWDGAMSSHPST